MRSITTSALALIFVLALALACAPAPEESAPEPEPVTVVPTRLTVGEAASADGTSIAYAAKGGGSPTLVFIHGWSCDRTYWSEQLDAFAQDHRVVTVDLAGHGDSGQGRAEWTLEAFGQDVKAVVEDLGLDEVVFIGHSMGGPVALEAAALLPDRARGVVLVDSIQDPDLDLSTVGWDQLLAGYRQDFQGSCDTMIRSMFLEDASQELVDRIQADMCSAPPQIAVRLLEKFGTYDAVTALRETTVPVRSINAATFPTDRETYEAHLGNWDLVVMEGVGHFLMQERPEEFNEHLRQQIESLDAPAPVSSAAEEAAAG